MIKDERIKLFAFVIMDNHIHLIWQMLPDNDPEAVQRDFLKYIAQRIKKDLQISHTKVLEYFKVDAKDREYLPIVIGIWERNALSIELRRYEVFIQKLEYIHWNPVKARMCNMPEEYKYTLALFYETGVDNWGSLRIMRIDCKLSWGRLQNMPLVFCHHTITLRNTRRRRASFRRRPRRAKAAAKSFNKQFGK